MRKNKTTPMFRTAFLAAALTSTALGAAVSLAGCGGGGGGDGDSHECVHGVLSSSTGACVCDLGYAGEKCDACADTWQDRDGDGTCLPDCGPHGKNAESWSVFDMRTACTCDEGYAGERCGACAAGFQDNDGDGACLPDCDRAGLSCPGGKVCDDASGKASCVDAPSDWTFMVYLDGDNNLGASIYHGEPSDEAAGELAAMQEGMKEAGEKAAGRINLIVLYDQSQMSDDPSTRVYRVTHAGLETLDSGTEIFQGREADMSSPDTLRKFGVWAVKHYPAAKYAMILMDHGGGWRDASAGGQGGGLPRHHHCDGGISSLLSKSGRIPAFRDFAVDETTGEDSSIALANGDYRKALEAIAAKAGKKLDLLAFDACLMGMYEVAMETASAADYMVASPEVTYGWTDVYDLIVKTLATESGMDGEAFARRLVDILGTGNEYTWQRVTYSLNANPAAYDLSKLPLLTQVLDGFAASLEDALGDATQRQAIDDIVKDQVMRFSYSDHADLRHLAMLVAYETEYGDLSEDLKAPANALVDALKQVVIDYRSNSFPDVWSGKDHENAYGMSAFLPRSVDCRYFDGAGGVPAQDSDDNIFTLYPCIHYPETPTELDTFYSRADVKNYVGIPWSTGWNSFLKAYLGL